MQLFCCTCINTPSLFFDNYHCSECGRDVGFIDMTQKVMPLNIQPDETYILEGDSNHTKYVQCSNRANYGVCNSMIPLVEGKEKSEAFCFACSLNEVIPDLRVEAHVPLWKKLEEAKRRTLYTINKLNLPVPTKAKDPENGLSFYFMTDKKAKGHFQYKLPGLSPIFTGHDQGKITINLAEADEVNIAKTKNDMNERYRTLLGHFRHEIGHFYWDVLISTNASLLTEYRELFGNERLDYLEAMKKHYKNGAIPNWSENYVSAYATMHPWEDWAETWSHYLHMIDCLATANAHDLIVLNDTDVVNKNDNFIYSMNIDDLILTWMKFSVKLNALNRSMGLEDAYPFVLNESVRRKLLFIHNVISC